MQRNSWLGSLALIVMLVIGMMSTNSCIFDAQKDDGGGEPPVTVVYGDLTQREHILTNLQLAYNGRNLEQYTKILDEQFTFFFGQADIDEGNVTSPSFDRNQEVSSSRNLFDPSFSAGGRDPVSRITLNMTWPKGENAWTEITSGGGETQYEKTVQYTLSVVAGETTFTNASALAASFVIRFDPVLQHYTVIQWRDDI